MNKLKEFIHMAESIYLLPSINSWTSLLIKLLGMSSVTWSSIVLSNDLVTTAICRFSHSTFTSYERELRLHSLIPRL